MGRLTGHFVTKIVDPGQGDWSILYFSLNNSDWLEAV